MRAALIVANASCRGVSRQWRHGFNCCLRDPTRNDDFPIDGEGALIERVQAPSEVAASLA
ncbi:MAG: hypothetical protein IV097_17660 [Burkholderiaceae bacterium]|nr:hypothetical protein [Burkholderiaceae bacterium]